MKKADRLGAEPQQQDGEEDIELEEETSESSILTSMRSFAAAKRAQTEETIQKKERAERSAKAVKVVGLFEDAQPQDPRHDYELELPQDPRDNNDSWRQGYYDDSQRQGRRYNNNDDGPQVPTHGPDGKKLSIKEREWLAKGENLTPPVVVYGTNYFKNHCGYQPNVPLYMLENGSVAANIKPDQEVEVGLSTQLEHTFLQERKLVLGSDEDEEQ